ncbi:MFS transporter [Acinetobacter towneri]|uniref:MFS transporter n=1 Tax=Acinetobacter towneri TaxID=202956 RepID=UPI002936B777|nr:MFS transporter [Acinetobacter towneri]MDV2455258.1 MFS transporter [Acinetobacter towneri]
MSSVRWLTKDLWIVAAGFMAAMHIGKLPPTVPILQAELGISLVQAGFLLSLVQAAGMSLALLLGSYTAKIGLKRCVLLGLSLLAGASFVGGFVHSFSALLSLRVIEGFGFLLITLSGPAFIRQLVAVEQLPAKMGLWSAYMGGGMGIGLLSTPFLLTILDWQGVWMCLGLLSFALAIIIYKAVPSVQISTQAIAIFELIKSTLSHPSTRMDIGFGFWCLCRAVVQFGGFFADHLSAISNIFTNRRCAHSYGCNGKCGGHICMWVVITAWAENASVDANGFCDIDAMRTEFLYFA